MSNPFSSALSYLSGHGGGGNGVSEGGSRFVGQTVDLGGNKKLKVKKVIAEGGYGYVFIAQDVQTGAVYALKRQVVARENVKAVKREIAFLRQLGDHPHIIKYVSSAGIPPSETSHGNAEFLIQTELCSGGQMEQIIRTSYLNPKQVLRVFYATCSAVAHMHSQQPPVVHRDLKVENLLLTADGEIKLCDFGSATTQQLNPDSSWTSVQRGLAEDEIQCNTTPMYRSPEMVDLYSNKLVNEKADIWALGCLLYVLCFRTHPFEDSGKLRIINANYKIPQEDRSFSMFHGIIKSCLVTDPTQRPPVDALLAKLYSISDQLEENMELPSTDLLELARAVTEDSEVPEGEDGGGGNTMSTAIHSTSQQAHKLFGFMKDGAGSLFKNIKDSSSKAINAMSATASPKHGLDITYITSRIIAMSYPHDDTLHGHPIHEVRAFLDEKHPSAYLVFNLSGSSYDAAKLNSQVYDFNWPQHGVPLMEKMVDLCRSMDAWLRADSQNIIVVHCHDGLSITPVAIVSYMLFIRAISSPLVGLKYVALKRRPDSPRVSGTPSQMRYLQHMARLVGQPPYKPHSHKLTLVMLKLSSVPLFNAIRTGCKPFVEVYQDEERIYTSAEHNSMDSIRSFHTDDKAVEVPLGITVQGNITVNVHHIRAIPVARKAGVGMTAVKMFYFQMHTGFMSSGMTSFKIDRKNLDGASVRKEHKFPSPFHAILEVEWDKSAEGTYNEASWQNLPYPKSSPLSCFMSVTEQEEVLKQLDPKKVSLLTRKLPEIPGTPTTPPTSHIFLHQNLSAMREEESSSAGGGNLLNLGDSGGPAPSQSGHNGGTEPLNNGQNFLSTLDWQQNAESTEYMPYQDQIPEDFESNSSSSSGSGGSSSSDDEFNEFKTGLLLGNGTPSDAFKRLGEDNGEEGMSLISESSSGGGGGGGAGAAPKEGRVTQGGSGHSAPFKLIEFGAEEAVTSSSTSAAKPPTSSSSSYLDPFQQVPSSSSRQHTTKSSSSDAAEVMFNPWSGFDQTENNSSKNTDSALGDLLGLNSDNSRQQPSPLAPQAEIRTSTTGETSGPGAGGRGARQEEDIFGLFGKSDASSQSHPDPFLQPTAATTTTTSSTQPSVRNEGGGDMFDLLGGSPSLMPTSTLPAPMSTAHHMSEPFTHSSGLLAPSMSGPPTTLQSRKLSSPVMMASTSSQVPLQATNLAPNIATSSVSLSHPNLSSFGTQPNNSAQQGLGTRGGSTAGFGTGAGFSGGMRGSASQNTSPRRSPSPVSMSSSTGNLSKQQQQQNPFDQFNLHQLSSGGNRPGVGGTAAPRPSSATTTTTTTTMPPPMGNNYQPNYMQQQQNQSRSGVYVSNSQPHVGSPNRQGNGVGSKPPRPGNGTGPKSKPAPTFQARPHSPNYNPSLFSSAGSKTGVPTKPKEDAFGDLLGSGFNPKKGNDSQTLKDLKSANAIDNALDPDRAKVAAWAEKKERNIRAIISSLHEILWEGETRWHEVGMHQLVQPDQVKKFYRKACLSVHPDKAQDSEHETLARAIFDELNDAYTKFEESGARPLY